MRLATRVSGFGTALSATLAAAIARAQDGVAGLETVGKPHAEGIGFQPAASELAVDQQWLDHMLMILCFAVVALVLALLVVVILRYNSRANPTPARFTHNTPVEIIWTLVPILILVVLGSFSLPILDKQQTFPVGEVNIKVTGNQWYWSYEYPDDGITFDSLLLPKDQLAANGYAEDEYLLAVDNAVVVPVNKIVVMHLTGADVIHSWALPAFAIKQDAVPGRISQAWFKADREGIYFGQCSELCGKDHSYMPIAVKVVSQQVYDEWKARAKVASAGTPAPAVKLASN